MNKQATAKALRKMLDNGRITATRAEYFAVGQCTSRHAEMRCGLPIGHDGEHTALIESDAPWLRANNKENIK